MTGRSTRWSTFTATRVTDLIADKKPCKRSRCSGDGSCPDVNRTRATFRAFGPAPCGAPFWTGSESTRPRDFHIDNLMLLAGTGVERAAVCSISRDAVRTRRTRSDVALQDAREGLAGRKRPRATLRRPPGTPGSDQAPLFWPQRYAAGRAVPAASPAMERTALLSSAVLQQMQTALMRPSLRDFIDQTLARLARRRPRILATPLKDRPMIDPLTTRYFLNPGLHPSRGKVHDVIDPATLGQSPKGRVSPQGSTAPCRVNAAQALGRCRDAREDAARAGQPDRDGRYDRLCDPDEPRDGQTLSRGHRRGCQLRADLSLLRRDGAR